MEQLKTESCGSSAIILSLEFYRADDVLFPAVPFEESLVESICAVPLLLETGYLI